MQRTADRALAGRPPLLGQLGAQQWHRPARRRGAVGLWVALGQQRAQRGLRRRDEPARLAEVDALRDAGNPLRSPGSNPVVHARLRAIQRLRDRRDGYPLRPQQHRLKAPPVPHRAAPRLGRVQHRALIGCQGVWHRLPSRSWRRAYHLNPLSSTHLDFHQFRRHSTAGGTGGRAGFPGFSRGRAPTLMAEKAAMPTAGGALRRAHRQTLARP